VESAALGSCRIEIDAEGAALVVVRSRGRPFHCEYYGASELCPRRNRHRCFDLARAGVVADGDERSALQHSATDFFLRAVASKTITGGVDRGRSGRRANQWRIGN